MCFICFCLSSRRRHTRCALVTGVQTCALPICAVPTSVPAPEVYNGIERGIFRAAAFPYTYAFASYKIDEIANWHTTNLAPGANNCPTIVGIQAYEALPDQYKALLAKDEPIAYKALQEIGRAQDGTPVTKEPIVCR